MGNLKLLNVLQGPSVIRGNHLSRPSHVFIFKLAGESRYVFGSETLTIARGEMLFIPQGSSYTVESLSGADGRYVLINFSADIPGARPEKYRISGRVDFAHLCARLSEYRFAETAADRHRLMSLFYEILSIASESAEADYHPASAFARLDPAVAYLKEHVFDPDLKIGQLHTLCGMSDTYFRRLFISRFDTSPKKYVLNRRLMQAKSRLETGEYNSIGEVARLSGFDDPLYFSKVFKQRYGCPPSSEK